MKNSTSASERRSGLGKARTTRDDVELVQLNIEVPKQLRVMWKHAALDRSTTVTQLVIDAMAKLLGK
jgi:hypothetical protein